MADTFLDTLTSQCADLQRLLADEYRSCICPLEEQIRRLSVENQAISTRLQRIAGGEAVSEVLASGWEDEAPVPNRRTTRSSSRVSRTSTKQRQTTGGSCAEQKVIDEKRATGRKTTLALPSSTALSAKTPSPCQSDDADEAPELSANSRKMKRQMSKLKSDIFLDDELTELAMKAIEETETHTPIEPISIEERQDMRGYGGEDIARKSRQRIVFESDQLSNEDGGKALNSKTSSKSSVEVERAQEDDEEELDSSSSMSSIIFEVDDIWKSMICRRARKLAARRGITQTLFGIGPRGSAFMGETLSATYPPPRFSRASTIEGPGDESVSQMRQVMVQFMMEPNCGRHLVWELLSFILVIYDLITVPLEAFEPEENPFTLGMEWVVRMFWTLDIVVHFLTGYLDSAGRTVLDPVFVAKRYAIRQLHLDLMVVGVDWAQQVVGIRATGVFRSWRVLRIVRLLRIKKAREIIELLSEHIRSERLYVVASVSKMLIMLVVLSHLIGCCLYALRRAFDDYGGSETEWLHHSYSLGGRYMQSFHFAICLFFGEHPVVLRTFTERAFASLCLALTFTLQIWFVSFITTAMTHQEIISTERSAKFSALNRFMTDHSVPREISMKVERNAKHALAEQERNTPEESIALLKLISDPLMMELHFEIHMPTLRVHPFMRFFADLNPSGARKICHTAISLLWVTRHDVLFLASESPKQSFHGPRTLFLASGELEYLRPEGERQIVTKDNWISEGALWTSDWIHFGTLRATCESRLVALSVDKFQELLKEAPFDCACTYASGYVDMLNRATEDAILSDIGTYTSTMAELLESVFPNEFPPVKAELDAKYGIKKEERRSSRRISTCSVVPDEQEEAGHHRSTRNTTTT